MQIGKTETYGITATARTAPSGTDAAAPAASAAANTATTAGAAPLTGGTRTTSLGIFNESPDKPATTDFAAFVAEKTKALSATLMAALKTAKIPTDEPMVLRLNDKGGISVDGPNKEQVEKFFENSPELVQQLKDIATLNTLAAMNKAMRLFAKTKKDAASDDERKVAESAYVADCLEIQARSGTMTLADGQLTSAAARYMGVNT